MQEMRTEELFGIAKKWSLELEQLPLHQHSAAVELLKTAMQSRAIGLQRAEHEAQMELQRQAVENQRQLLELNEAAARREASENLTGAPAVAGPKLVTR